MNIRSAALVKNMQVWLVESVAIHTEKLKHNGINMLKTITPFVFMLVLSGCGTLIGIDIRSNDELIGIKPPDQPPRIIYGQKAYVFGKGDNPLAQAWRETGLFSSVENTNSRIAPANGVLITSNCTYSHTRGDEFGIHMISFLSIGLIPIFEDNIWYCNQEFTQNGVVIAKVSTKVTNTYMKGWLELAFKNKEEAEQRRSAQISVNAMLSALK